MFRWAFAELQHKQSSKYVHVLPLLRSCLTTADDRAEDMPLTFMRYFYIGANLRWLLATIDWPDEAPFHAMMVAYDKVFRDAARSNPRLASLRPFGGEGMEKVTFSQDATVTLADDIYRRLLACITSHAGPIFSSLLADINDLRPALSNTVNQLHSFDHGGVQFGTGSSHKRDSFIVFETPGYTGSYPRAGQIHEIMLHPRMQHGKEIVEPFFIVNEYVPLSVEHQTADPYRQYRDLETQLFYNRFKPEPRVIALQDIRVHFAAFVYSPEEIGQECIVVRSLDRVCDDHRCAAALN